MILFALGFLAGILTTIVFSVAWHLRSEREKRRVFEREIAAINLKYPPSTQATPHVPPQQSPTLNPSRKDVH